MPETPTLDSLKQNGDFQALSDGAKQIVLSKWYPDYAKLSFDAQTSVLSNLKGEPENPALRGATQATFMGPDTRPWYQRLEDWATHFVEDHRPGTDIAGLNDPRVERGQTMAGNFLTGPIVGPARVVAGTARLITGAPSAPDQVYPRIAAVNEILGGVGQTFGPVAMLHPAALPALAIGGATEQTVQEGATALGAPPEVSELAGNVAGIAAGVKAAKISAGTPIAVNQTKPTYSTPSETAPEALPLKEAGQRIQQEAQSAREAVGEALGAAKEKLAESLTQTTNGEAVSMTLSPTSPAVLMGQKVLAGIKSAAKLGITDPDMESVQNLAERFATRTDTEGKMLTFDPDAMAATDRGLNAQISALSRKVAQGANGTALGYLKQLKGAFDESAMDFFESVGDEKTAEQVKALRRQYAESIADQKRGPAKNLLSAKNPETVISSIVSRGANAESAVESLARNLTPDGMEVLRDSVTQEIYRRNTLPSGDIDMLKVQAKLASMGDAAKSLYGDRYEGIKNFIDDAAELQTKKNTPGLASKLMRSGVKAAATGAGAAVAHVPGAIAGHVVGESLADMLPGQSGRFVGIAPEEKVPAKTEQP